MMKTNDGRILCDSCLESGQETEATTKSTNPDYSGYDLCDECAAEYDSRIHSDSPTDHLRAIIGQPYSDELCEKYDWAGLYPVLDADRVIIEIEDATEGRGEYYDETGWHSDDNPDKYEWFPGLVDMAKRIRDDADCEEVDED